ncbi:hypothetical protein Pse7429DRAFT_0248 [Pseudanabaena biceps PCC 7429]|uniref:Uncharacterized protein n=1 Tax=Pseudanabaena biceps PCC 7429 TaxID=927668 RepID=L8N2N6_9CYAN|nr:hypothetical protein Pse7429DRAFT_0248 [Pseudanabaena biceps PCC 7429]
MWLQGFFRIKVSAYNNSHYGTNFKIYGTCDVANLKIVFGRKSPNSRFSVNQIFIMKTESIKYF